MPKPRPAKRRRLTPPDSEADSAAKRRAGPSLSNPTWDLEDTYAQRPRKTKVKAANKLPIRTAEGWVVPEAQEEVGEPEDAAYAQAGAEADDDDMADAPEPEPEPKLSNREQVMHAKEELARLAGLINEDPEEHAPALKALAHVAASPNVAVKKLAMATQCAVYKDIIPGYRIRPIGEDDMGSKISKEVRKLRQYEQGLVGGYQDYIRELEKLARGGRDRSPEAESLVSAAIACACNLLLAVPHFNFRGDLLKILVNKLSTKKLDNDYTKCIQTLEKLFENDDDGRPSLDAVTMLTKMIKGKHFQVHESTINTFLHLRLLTEFNHKGSDRRIDKDTSDGPKPKQKRVYRSKKERKMAKERKEVENVMKEADAVVTHEERDKMQAETLKLVFALYFRILKARTPHLMGAVLEGLARYAHLINQDFFGDLLEALKDLIRDAEEDEEEEQDEQQVRNITREQLLCVVTAFALLQGQEASKAASTLHLDLDFFIGHLYRTLHGAAMNADIELGAKSLRLPDPLATEAPSAAVSKVNAQTTVVLLLRSLTAVLVPPIAARAVPPVRVAAFTKQLLSAALQLPEKSATAVLALLGRVAKVQGKKVAGLWNTEERRGDGVFDPLRGELESSNPFASTAWEGELLRLHYCPKVREAAALVEKTIKEV
ncbi:nucleolar complex protein-like protein 3 [Trichodelitschia bisporula]|uniref:Nucleolar complex-associated protein 3 n=1 Tax=Trichodelitschia bisporula TaxID=703511 RepID=A0A6G1HYA1_9PEZI|nr:nucleolar complex protein-like protein 3 [Trichodelitschia bisporula]